VWNSILTDHKENLTLTDPKGEGFASPDPLGAGPAVFDLQGNGSASLDPRGTGSVVPDPMEMVPPRLTQGLWGQPRARARAPMRAPAAPNRYEHGVWAQDHAPNAREGWAHLDVADGHHKLYLGSHIPNSVRRTGTVLLDPRATPDMGSVDHTTCQEGMEHHGQAAAPTYRTSDG
jgi:hypothetical protein